MRWYDRLQAWLMWLVPPAVRRIPAAAAPAPRPTPPFRYWDPESLLIPETPTQVLAYLCYRHRATHRVRQRPNGTWEVALVTEQTGDVRGLGMTIDAAIRAVAKLLGYQSPVLGPR